VILEDDVVDGEERHIEVVGVDFVLEDAVVDGAVVNVANQGEMMMFIGT